MRRLTILLVSLLAVAPAFAGDAFVVHATDVVDRKAVIATVEPVASTCGARAHRRYGRRAQRQRGRHGRRGRDNRRSRRRKARAADAGARLAHRLAAVAARSGQGRLRPRRRIAEARRFSRRPSSTRRAPTLKSPSAISTRCRATAQVIAEQAAEGAVLSPGAGRVLTVPVSVGRVVLPGETIATLAEDQYILRLQLPERHAQFLRAGDKVRIGARGLGDEGDAAKREGACASSIPRSRAAG